MLPEERRRSDRSYETVQRMPPEQFSPEQGFRLRVTGRIERLPGGKAVQCIQPAGIEQQPICLVAVSFRSEEHTSELQSLMRISYAVFCLKKKIKVKSSFK